MKFLPKDYDTHAIAHVRFTSGRTVESSGVIGLNLTDGSVCDCWDQSDFVTDNDAAELPLTPIERRDLADFMIARWRAFAEGDT